jgi:hypothetical protein
LKVKTALALIAALSPLASASEPNLRSPILSVRYTHIVGPQADNFTMQYYSILVSEESVSDKMQRLNQLCEIVEEEGVPIWIDQSRFAERTDCWMHRRIKCCRPVNFSDISSGSETE